jgi:DNA-binding XRE family transcriptional regulator
MDIESAPFVSQSIQTHTWDFIGYNVPIMPLNRPSGPNSAQSSRLARSRVARALRETGGGLATWRKLQGLTQAQLADRAGVNRKTVMRLEHGDGGVSVENLFRVLRVLGVLDHATQALDPLQTDVGRMRADERLPQRVRPKALS